ncbi:hypothetical protein TBK1r_24360 [Stieleria magnilauensis]|uniref:Uncharacterized protein n=1 Tax=Stieleria magnilauensis TaxID=2527963 RepID=A0ABX5XQ66_9BACT|nr:hypothetical protein TBK1r_24360 [Planctomycetes bacterium TBK1r]
MPQVPGTVGRPRIDQARGGNSHRCATTIRATTAHAITVHEADSSQSSGVQCCGFRINDRVVPPLPDEDVCQAAG